MSNHVSSATPAPAGPASLGATGLLPLLFFGIGFVAMTGYFMY